MYCSDHCANDGLSRSAKCRAHTRAASELVMSMAASPCAVRRRQSRRTVQPGSQEEISHGLSKTTQSSQEKHQEGDQSRQAKTNPETPPEENPPSSRQASGESQTITQVASAFAPQSRRVHRVHSQHLWSADSPTLAVEVISGEVKSTLSTHLIIL